MCIAGNEAIVIGETEMQMARKDGSRREVPGRFDDTTWERKDRRGLTVRRFLLIIVSVPSRALPQ